MIKLESLKSKIIASMVSLSLITAIVIGGFSVYDSSQIISNNAKEMLLNSSKNKSNEIYNDLKQVEKNVNLMGSFIKSTSSIYSQNDMNKLSSNDSEYSKIRIYVKELGENTKWAMSSYFYFDQKYIPDYDGAWFVGNNGNFKRKIINGQITRADCGWYFDPMDAKNGLWAAPYEDTDLKVSMITYSTPVYKKGIFLGIAGMDITLDQLNKMVQDIKIYKTTDAYIIDSKFNFIAGDKFKLGDNLLKVNNGLYNFLEKNLSKEKSGYAEYRDNAESKVITYSTLPNGFILLIEVPLSEVLSQMNNMVFLIALLAIISVVVAVIVAIKIGVIISKPIENLVQISLKYAENDFTVEIQEDCSSTEIKNLSRAFKKFAENLKKLIKQVNKTVEEVSSGADVMSTVCDQTALGSQQVALSTTQLSQGAQQIATGVTQLAAGAQEQAKLVNNSLSNINSINKTIQYIAKGAEDTIQISKNSETDASNGYNQAAEAVEKVNQIKVSTTEISRTIDELGKLSSDIEMIVDLIKNIANQTNLLSLNAAIEAARAGANGKGFAVVAEEVKKLASQSAEATDKITSMIKEVQNKTNYAVTSMNRNVQEVDGGVTIIENVGHSLEQILNAAKVTKLQVQEISKEMINLSNNSVEVVKMVENIAAISEESAVRAEEISTITEESAASSEEIASITEEQTASLEEINASSQNLAKIAENLQKQVAVFKV